MLYYKLNLGERLNKFYLNKQSAKQMEPLLRILISLNFLDMMILTNLLPFGVLIAYKEISQLVIPSSCKSNAEMKSSEKLRKKIEKS